MKIGNRVFNDHTYIMGILNVTPDSFSDGGRHNSLDSALEHAEKMILDGADVIDVGGESTRPGHKQITDEEEIERIAPVIEKIKNNFDIPVSIDTYKSAVALEAIKSGADMVNDIWGLKYDSKMADIIKEYECACCLMHNRENTDYNNYMPDVLNDLRDTITITENANIPANRIMIDPGVGFAKSYEQNLEIINKLEMLHSLNYPILLGTSRKSVIGLALNLPADQRLEGTLATTALAVMKSCLFVRVHDVLENKRMITMIEKIIYSGKEISWIK